MKLVPGMMLLVLLAAGCAGESRERLKTLGPLPAATENSDTVLSSRSGSARVDLTPTKRNRKVGTEQVLIATVYDNKGELKHHGKVEWSIDGPGEIVELDEGGLLFYRGKRVDSRYGYSYSSSSKRTVSRKRDDPRDDFDLQPGQTWCIVRSNEPGECRVTARIPDGPEGRDGAAVATIRWQGGEKSDESKTTEPVSLPKGGPGESDVSLDLQLPSSMGLNSESTVRIVVANGGQKESQPLTVQAVIPDDVEVLRIEPLALKRVGNTMTWAFERLAAESHEEILVKIRPSKKGNLFVTTAATTADGLRAERRLGTLVDTAGLKLSLQAPSTGATGDEIPVKVTLQNTGSVTIENAHVWLDIPNALAQPIEKTIPSIPPEGTKTITIPVTVDRKGSFIIRVNSTANGGLTDRTESKLEIAKADLELTLSGVETVPIGQEGIVDLRITNRGDAPLGRVTVQAYLPTSLTARSASDGGRVNSEGAGWVIGTLAAGETKVVRLSVSGEKLEEKIKLSASAKGELASGQTVSAREATSQVSITGLPVLSVQLREDHDMINVGQTTRYRIEVRNRGTASARDISVALALTDELRIRRTTSTNRQEAKVDSGTASFPDITELKPGETFSFLVEAEALKAGSARAVVTVKSLKVDQPLREEHAIAIRATRKK